MPQREVVRQADIEQLVARFSAPRGPLPWRAHILTMPIQVRTLPDLLRSDLRNSPVKGCGERARRVDWRGARRYPGLQGR